MLVNLSLESPRGSLLERILTHVRLLVLHLRATRIGWVRLVHSSVTVSGSATRFMTSTVWTLGNAFDSQ